MRICYTMVQEEMLIFHFLWNLRWLWHQRSVEANNAIEDRYEYWKRIKSLEWVVLRILCLFVCSNFVLQKVLWNTQLKTDIKGLKVDNRKIDSDTLLLSNRLCQLQASHWHFIYIYFFLIWKVEEWWNNLENGIFLIYTRGVF